MFRQIMLLSKVQICNLFGMNEFKYTKDSKKKNRAIAMMAVYAIVILMCIMYLLMMSYGLLKIGVPDAIPIALYTLTSIIILCFTFLKASGIIFQMNSYELLVSFPVSGSAIVVSRFFTMYVTNLLLSIFVMIPGTIIYGIGVKPGVLFYVYELIGTIFLPLIPITIATAIGAAITAISSRMKHKSIVSAFLSVLIALVVVVGSMSMPSDTSQIDIEALKDLTSIMLQQVKHFYIPAYWFGDSTLNGNAVSMLLLIAVSVLIFVVMIAVLQKGFISICSALNATSAKNNYKMQQLKTNSIVTALWKRELKRYLASSVYVINTVIGYILMAAFGISLLFMSAEQLEEMLGMPHIIVKLFPLLLGIIGNIMPTTSASISMEGKQWWIAQTLPIRMKDLILSKILVNLTVAAPFYLVGAIAGAIALRPGLTGCIWIFVIPAVYTVFCSFIGITLNLLLPVLEWDNETRVVKQSAAGMLSMVISVIAMLPAIAAVLALKNVSTDIIMFIATILLIVFTVVLYQCNNRRKIINVGN